MYFKNNHDFLKSSQASLVLGGAWASPFSDLLICESTTCWHPAEWHLVQLPVLGVPVAGQEFMPFLQQ